MFIDGGSTKIALPVRRRDSLEIRVIFGIQQPEGERGCVERCFARRTKPRSVKEKKMAQQKAILSPTLQGVLGGKMRAVQSQY